MERGNHALPSRETPLLDRPVTRPVWGVRQRSRTHRPRWVPIFFYVVLFLLNVSVLALFAGGDLGLGVAHLFQKVSPGGGTDAEAAIRLQYPPGENWGNREGVTPQPMPNGR
ncbi:MAG: hypothetical protein ABIK65_13260 [Candidatus Eisenbacteria bacterium]